MKFLILVIPGNAGKDNRKQNEIMITTNTTKHTLLYGVHNQG